MTVTEQCSMSTAPFVAVIGSATGMIVAHTSVGDGVYTRIWCCREIFEAMQKEACPITHGDSQQFEEAVAWYVKYSDCSIGVLLFVPYFCCWTILVIILIAFGWPEMWGTVLCILHMCFWSFFMFRHRAGHLTALKKLKVDTAKAKASNTADKLRIDTEIKAITTYAKIDEAIQNDRNQASNTGKYLTDKPIICGVPIDRFFWIQFAVFFGLLLFILCVAIPLSIHYHEKSREETFEYPDEGMGGHRRRSPTPTPTPYPTPTPNPNYYGCPWCPSSICTEVCN